LIVIGASVGGPRTITTILKDIPKDFPCPILVVQYLTPQFINTFVNTLNDVCKITIKIAKNEEYIQTGIVYIAPGDNHMEVSVKNDNPFIKIYKGTPVHFCMPSIDVLFFSAARIYRNRIMTIFLTGMGEDGVDELDTIQKLGGKTITKSQKTCVLYGMSKLAKERGAYYKIRNDNFFIISSNLNNNFFIIFIEKEIFYKKEKNLIKKRIFIKKIIKKFIINIIGGKNE
jgi:two-component system chemotaxis response regulator CheB